LEVPASVREGSLDDVALLATVDRAVRGAARTVDLEVILTPDSRLLVIDGRGYAIARGSTVYLLAATDEDAARDLLRAATAPAPAAESIKVEGLTSAQNWAVEVVLEAGLEISMHGAQFLRGDVGPFRPYLPSGAYL